LFPVVRAPRGPVALASEQQALADAGRQQVGLYVVRECGRQQGHLPMALRLRVRQQLALHDLASHEQAALRDVLGLERQELLRSQAGVGQH
jgi:hypothetical protein